MTLEQAIAPYADLVGAEVEQHDAGAATIRLRDTGRWITVTVDHVGVADGLAGDASTVTGRVNPTSDAATARDWLTGERPSPTRVSA